MIFVGLYQWPEKFLLFLRGFLGQIEPNPGQNFSGEVIQNLVG